MLNIVHWLVALRELFSRPFSRIVLETKRQSLQHLTEILPIYERQVSLIRQGGGNPDLFRLIPVEISGLELTELGEIRLTFRLTNFLLFDFDVERIQAEALFFRGDRIASDKEWTLARTIPSLSQSEFNWTIGLSPDVFATLRKVRDAHDRFSLNIQGRLRGRIKEHPVALNLSLSYKARFSA